MGTYAAQSDLESTFGVTNIAKWSQLSASNTTTTADTTRIAWAISVAESQVNLCFRNGLYNVPLVGNSGTPPELTQWVSVIAGLLLLRSRPGNAGADQNTDYIDIEDRVNREILAVVGGEKMLNCTLNNRGGSITTAPWVVR